MYSVQKQLHLNPFYYILLVVLLCLGACSGSDELPSKDNGHTEMVELAIVMSELDIEHDDIVSEIRLLAFNKEGRCIINQLLSFNGNTSLNMKLRSTSKRISDPIKVLSGTYDFLFIANETSEILSPKFRTSLYDLSSKKELLEAPFTSIEYIGEQNLEIYEKSLIPMSAYYTAVNVKNTVTDLDNPIRFPHEVLLVRAFAKLEVNFRNKSENKLTYKRVEHIQVVNLAKRYSVPASSKLYSKLYPNETAALNIPVKFTEDAYKNELIGQIILFIPEFLRDKRKEITHPTTLLFTGKGFYDHELILRELDGFADFKNQARLLDFKLLSHYSIIRNTKFAIDVFLTNSRDLESVVEILPWNKVSSSQDFGIPEFNTKRFRIKVGSHSFTKTQEIAIKTGEEVNIKFQLDKPRNALWRASLTNGTCFDFGETNVSEGVSGKEYTIKVKATQPWNGTPNYTEFYITTQTKEVPLWKDSFGSQNRYLFKQVE